jgi:hypothetical protein
VQELDQGGGRLVGELGGQADDRQIVGAQHDAHRALRWRCRALALAAARSWASLRR